MGYMRIYERDAVERVHEAALKKEVEDKFFVDQICQKYDADAGTLQKKLLSSPITLNFHPDRFSNNGRMIIENLIDDGIYLGQFKTGTTNGGKTAFIGGNRFKWEQRLFSNAYPDEALDRPKYGALNIFDYLDGASPRFGSCFFTLKHSILPQCTFAYGDSSEDPETLCTAESFVGILAALLADVSANGRMLNRENTTVSEAVGYISNIGSNEKMVGRNLDHCIEAHIHGDLSLSEDVGSLHLDESYFNTAIHRSAEKLVKKFNIDLKWIPIRQIKIAEIDDTFRGPVMKPLASRIDSLYGRDQGVINALLLGKASRSSISEPAKWSDFGSADQLFQFIKQLWHTVAFFG